jgi:hypothetical protein
VVRAVVRATDASGRLQYRGMLPALYKRPYHQLHSNRCSQRSKLLVLHLLADLAAGAVEDLGITSPQPPLLKPLRQPESLGRISPESLNILIMPIEKLTASCQFIFIQCIKAGQAVDTLMVCFLLGKAVKLG